MTIVLTTHYMEEAQALADRIVIMNEGRVMAIGTLEELENLTGKKGLEDVFVSIAENIILHQIFDLFGVPRRTHTPNKNAANQAQKQRNTPFDHATEKAHIMVICHCFFPLLRVYKDTVQEQLPYARGCRFLPTR